MSACWHGRRKLRPECTDRINNRELGHGDICRRGGRSYSSPGHTLLQVWSSSFPASRYEHLAGRKTPYPLGSRKESGRLTLRVLKEASASMEPDVKKFRIIRIMCKTKVGFEYLRISLGARRCSKLNLKKRTAYQNSRPYYNINSKMEVVFWISVPVAFPAASSTLRHLYSRLQGDPSHHL